MFLADYTFGGVIAYAPKWLSDTGLIECFPLHLDRYCPSPPRGCLGLHNFYHDVGFLGGCRWTCYNCKTHRECGCS